MPTVILRRRDWGREIRILAWKPAPGEEPPTWLRFELWKHGVMGDPWGQFPRRLPLFWMPSTTAHVRNLLYVLATASGPRGLTADMLKRYPFEEVQ